MKLKLPKLFQNKYLLYVVLVIAVANVLGYLAKEKYNAVTFFLAIGLLSSYFTKNMTVVLLISILSTSLVSTQRIVEGFDAGEKKYKVGDDISEEIKGTDSEPIGSGADDIMTEETGLPNGLKVEFQSGGVGLIKITGKAETAGTFDYEIKFKVPEGQTAPESVKGKMIIEAATTTSTTPTGVCKAADPNDDPGNCGDFGLEKDCVGKCKWNPATAQPAKAAIKASEKAKGGKPDEFKKFCTEELNDATDATHTKGQGNEMKYYKQHFYDNQGNCPIPSAADKCESSDQCQDYQVFSGFSSMGKRNNIVASTSREGRVDGVDESEGDRIDYAETTKQAYDNLQKMLGADGMKGLASETQKLVAQQKELVDSLGQMAPVLNSAKSTLDSLNLPDMKGITNILSTLKGK